MSHSDLFLALAAATLPRPGDTLDQSADRLERALRAVELGTNFATTPATPRASSVAAPPADTESRDAGRVSDEALQLLRDRGAL